MHFGPVVHVVTNPVVAAIGAMPHVFQINLYSINKAIFRQVLVKACLHYNLNAHSMGINANYFRPRLMRITRMCIKPV